MHGCESGPSSPCRSAARAVGQLDLGMAGLGELVRIVERRVQAARLLAPPRALDDPRDLASCLPGEQLAACHIRARPVLGTRRVPALPSQIRGSARVFLVAVLQTHCSRTGS
jgi:hypothetical protein